MNFAKKETISINENTCPVIKMRDGYNIPVLGFGTSSYGTSSLLGDECFKTISYAIKIGYRHFDTAICYNNQKSIGKAFNSNKDIHRDNLYLTTKLWTNNHGKENTQKAIISSLKEFNLKYINLYLIHSPIGGKNIETYLTLLEYKKKGYIKSIGVSNLGITHFERFKLSNIDLPVINQIEYNPWMQQKKHINYCIKNNILIESFSPLTKGQKIKNTNKNKIDQRLINISNKYNKNYGQILIKWNLQKNNIVLVKSKNKKRIKTNFNMFNWKLDNKDIKILDQFDENYHCIDGWDVPNMIFKDNEF